MNIAVVGLGYVGLPLAIALARKHDVVGFDISGPRVAALREGNDSTQEVSAEALRSATLTITDRADDMRGCEVFIVTVPTPIDAANRPDFEPILRACELLGPVIAKGAIIVFESTVYPGVTEEICAPALERSSGLKAGSDFKLRYSPERINPGDKERPLEKITKIVSGEDEATLNTLAEIYVSVIEAGIHRAPSIKVAEAAKVIENTQRDLNIALMNEIAKICHLLGNRTTDVLAAAGTKWNFLKFYPGLVGGHCIGVDPYYLTAKAE
ncbi:MAG TPA: nucleotide sugar dehydrogenase [Sphingomicrobium sp.]